jgi:hypothetical protein
MPADGQTSGFRRDPVTPAPHRVSELGACHVPTVHRNARIVLALAVPGRWVCWLTRRSPGIVVA